MTNNTWTNTETWSNQNGLGGKFVGDALYLPGAGNFYKGSLFAVGNGGFYWSSTIYSATNANYFGMTASNQHASLNGARSENGYSIRCVAE